MENNQNRIELRNAMAIILDQNVPNPFQDETDIRYLIPDGVVSAFLIFFDQSGRVVQKVELKEPGAGSLHVYAPDLQSGMYSYSLVADGKVMETKAMMKMK